MDNLIGAIAVAILAILSVVGQILEARKKSELEKEERRQQAEKVPEATRRALYGERGEAEIPMATPKQGAPSVPPPPPPPMQRQESMPSQPAQRRQVPVAPRRQVEYKRPVQQSSQRRVEVPPKQPTSRPSPAPQSPRELLPPETKRRVQNTLQEIWRQAQQAAQGEIEMEPPRPPQSTPRPKKQRPVKPQPVVQREPEEGEGLKPIVRRPTPQKIPPKPAHPLMRGLLGTRNNIRRGILLSEILGPPKGLQ